LRRPPKNKEISAAQKQQRSADQPRRHEVEGCLGSETRKYSLDLIMAWLGKGAEYSIFISIAFVEICAEKFWRLLRLFFVTIFAWIYACQSPGFLWMALGNILQLETEELLVTS
jgi:transposase, IS5 family